MHLTEVRRARVLGSYPTPGSEASGCDRPVKIPSVGTPSCSGRQPLRRAAFLGKGCLRSSGTSRLVLQLAVAVHAAHRQHAGGHHCHWSGETSRDRWAVLLYSNHQHHNIKAYQHKRILLCLLINKCLGPGRHSGSSKRRQFATHFATSLACSFQPPTSCPGLILSPFRWLPPPVQANTDSLYPFWRW